MMHYPISATRKPVRICYVLLLSLIVSITISTTFNPTLYRFTISLDTASLHSFNTIYEEKSTGIATAQLHPICRVVKKSVDQCEMEGDVRVDSKSSTVFLIRPRSSISAAATTSWTIKPYPRKSLTFIRNWTVRLVADDDAVPKCTQTHHSPALLFSIGGFTYNHYHDYADVLFPLYTTSSHLKRNVHFLASDAKPGWLSKYQPLLHQLTKHPILVLNRQKHDIHCYSKLTAGLKFLGDFVVDPTSTSGVGMSQFRQLLRRAHSLGRVTAVVRSKPRLMIILRKRSRILVNEAQVSHLAADLGFEVVSAEYDPSKNYTEFAQLVNSCDVLMGVHGAGLTNMLFLPDKAVIIQVVPFGGIGAIARDSYETPSAAMNLSCLNYKIEVNESSLIQRYSLDHPAIKNPMSIHRQGFAVFRKVYFHNQNVTIDVHRFRHTLAKAVNLLLR